LVGGSFQASILVLVFVNVAILVTQTVDNYKRKRLLDDLKKQYIERITEYREKKHLEAVQIKETRAENVKNWKHRK
jgi:hypothetical protein